MSRRVRCRSKSAPSLHLVFTSFVVSQEWHSIFKVQRFFTLRFFHSTPLHLMLLHSTALHFHRFQIKHALGGHFWPLCLSRFFCSVSGVTQHSKSEVSLFNKNKINFTAVRLASLHYIALLLHWSGGAQSWSWRSTFLLQPWSNTNEPAN